MMMKEEEKTIGKKELEEYFGMELTDDQYCQLKVHNMSMMTETRKYPVFHIMGVLKTLGLI